MASLLFTGSLSTLLATTFATVAMAGGQECDCYLTNGSTPSYFASHMFQDFREIDASLASQPAALTSEDDTGNAGITSAFFSDESWTNSWQIQAWNTSSNIASVGSDATMAMYNSLNNVYLEKPTDASSTHSTHLTLRTTRQPDFQSVAEIDSVTQDYQHLSIRLYARVVGPPGACAGIFTYFSPTTNSNAKNNPSSSQSIQEADTEILTSGPRNKIQYTNQPSTSPSGQVLTQATSNSTMTGSDTSSSSTNSESNELDWSNWNVYRYDWTPSRSEWYMNGVSQAVITYQAPRDPAGLIINLWSDGGDWTGSMIVHEYAYVNIQWIEILYNTSSAARKGRRDAAHLRGLDKRAQEGCKLVCSVDDGTGAGVGTPVLVVDNTADAMTAMRAVQCGRVMLLGIFVAIAGSMIIQ